MKYSTYQEKPGVQEFFDDNPFFGRLLVCGTVAQMVSLTFYQIPQSLCFHVVPDPFRLFYMPSLLAGAVRQFTLNPSTGKINQTQMSGKAFGKSEMHHPPIPPP